MKKKLILLSTIMMFIFSLMNAATFKGKCVKVVDGDTILVSLHKKNLTVHFDCIDCPELEQPFGKEAEQFTSSIVLKQKVIVEITTYEEDGTIVGRVYVNDKDMSVELMEAGLAWYYKKHDEDKKLAKIQKKIKKGKKGIWSKPNPTAPWVFRRVKELEKKKSEATDSES